jgi:hypothetical protein
VLRKSHSCSICGKSNRHRKHTQYCWYGAALLWTALRALPSPYLALCALLWWCECCLQQLRLVLFLELDLCLCSGRRRAVRARLCGEVLVHYDCGCACRGG